VSAPPKSRSHGRRGREDARFEKKKKPKGKVGLNFCRPIRGREEKTALETKWQGEKRGKTAKERRQRSELSPGVGWKGGGGVGEKARFPPSNGMKEKREGGTGL